MDFSPAGGNNDLGDILFPIETGNINQVFVSDNNPNYKAMVIEGNHYFAYGHIFFDGIPDDNGMQCGAFILKRMDFPNDIFYTIIYCPENGDPIAYGELENATVTHPDLNNGLPIEITTTVESIDNPICPIGNSGGNYSGHLHLYSFEEEPDDIDFNSNWTSGYPLTHFRNAKDPLEFITYPQPSYDIIIDETRDLTESGTNQYFSGEIEAAAKVVCTMQGATGGGNYPTVMDLNTVELFYKRSFDANENNAQNWGQGNSNYKLFKGPYFESKFCMGATLNTDRYPSYQHPSNLSENLDIANPVRQGNINRTGINGTCYNSDPFDEFYFSDIVTRISKEDDFGHENRLYASYPGEARTNDGEYNLYVRTTTVRNEVDASNDPYNILIDNFRPYISSVKIYRDNGQGELLVHNEWKWENEQLVFYPTTYAIISQSDNLYVEVEASEPLSRLGISVPTLSYEGSSENPLEDSEGRTFGFSMGASSSTGSHQIEFEGYDLAENGLQTDPRVISIRQEDGSWMPAAVEGIDVNHSFNVGADAPPIADFTPIEKIIYVGGEIDFMSLSENNPEQWHWDFGTGDTSNETNPSYTFLNPGIFDVRLTVSNNHGSSSKTGSVEVKEHPQLTAMFEGNPKHTIVGNNIEFTDHSVSPNSTITSWSWEFQGASSSISNLQNPMVVYQNPGTYDVKLTVHDEQGNSDTKYISDYISIIEEQDDLEVYCNISSYGSPGQNIPFTLGVFNGTPPYNYTFTVGGHVVLQEASYDDAIWGTYTPQNSGNYNYFLEVTDDNGNTGIDNGIMSIGQMCSHHVDFVYDFEEGSSGLLKNVVFTDLTSGGFEPYTEWLWHFGNEVGSGASPITSSGSTQELILNYNGDPNVSGNPTIEVMYPEYGTYPITLTVYDQEGCGKTQTQYLSISEQESCISLHYYKNPISVHPSTKLIKSHRASFSCNNTYHEENEGCTPWGGLSSEYKCLTHIEYNILNTSYYQFTNYHDSSIPASDWTYSQDATFEIPTLNLEQGKYVILANVWNDNWTDNASAPFPLGSEGDHKWYDTGENEFMVIDCDLVVEINEDPVSGENEIVNGGEITLSSSNNVNINSGVEVIYEACRIVDMNEGTDILSGSDFIARIEESCNEQYNEMLTESNKEQILSVDTEEILTSLFYPNPTNGMIYYRTNVYDESYNSVVHIMVYNQFGALLFETESLTNEEIGIDLSAFDNGTYFIKIGVEVSKVILLK